MAFSLITERLVLEDLVPQDLDPVRRVAQDPLFRKYVFIWLDTDGQIEAFLRHAIEEAGRGGDRRDYVLAARDKTTGAFAGLTFIEIDPVSRSTAEVGVVLLPEYSGKGYGTEILRAYLAFGFEKLGMHRVYGKCDELNIPSARTLERCGLRYEGTIREHVWLRDHWRSTKYYGILRHEYVP